jgi:hypothetical protein
MKCCETCPPHLHVTYCGQATGCEDGLPHLHRNRGAECADSEPKVSCLVEAAGAAAFFNFSTFKPFCAPFPSSFNTKKKG